MRDIKFRAWWEGVKQMKYFIPGNFEDTPRGWCMTFVQENDSESIFIGKAEIMQFTGLKDKNGKEIYEGDILSYKSTHPKHDGKIFNNAVEFATGQLLCGWRMRNRSCVVKATPYKFMCSEIIGNIYETPELLNQQTPTP